MAEERMTLEQLALSAQHIHAEKPKANTDLTNALAAKKEMLAEGSKGVSTKWWSIMTMQMRGLTAIEIASRLGMTPQTVSNITRSQRYKDAYKGRLDGLDAELYALKPKAIQAFTNGLVSTNTDTALRAATEFFKITGQGTYGRQDTAPSGSVGAEALAKQLLLASKQEVHVHVHQGSPKGGMLEVDTSDGSQGSPKGGDVAVESTPKAGGDLTVDRDSSS